MFDVYFAISRKGYGRSYYRRSNYGRIYGRFDTIHEREIRTASHHTVAKYAKKQKILYTFSHRANKVRMRHLANA